MTFIDLFSGIGGFRIAAESFRLKCVFSSEINACSQYTYYENFKEMPKHDICNIESKDIPNHDILFAGFPCQPFSQIGQNKGFEDTRGNLFFEIARILKDKQPKAFLLENVRNLKSHNHGKTLEIILKTLDDLGYVTFHRVLKACDYGLPTLRPRMYIVGFKNDVDFKFPESIPLKFTLNDLFKGQCNRQIAHTIRCGGRRSGLNDRHNWDTYLVDDKERVLTVKECYKLMGFPDNFKINPVEYVAFEQIGNSVAIDVIKYIIFNMLETLND